MQEYKHRVYSFAIEFKQDKISLKIPSDGLKVDDKWDIVPLFPPEVSLEYVQISSTDFNTCVFNHELVDQEV